jgi:hypothetical protein
MDGLRIDALARAVGRRGAVGALLALLGGGGLALLLDADPAVLAGSGTCGKKRKGRRCRRNKQCCSGRCKRKKNKKRGRCRCSQIGARCSAPSDCCPPAFVNALLPACEASLGAQTTVCCMPPLAACVSDTHCCGIATCENDHCFVP